MNKLLILPVLLMTLLAGCQTRMQMPATAPAALRLQSAPSSTTLPLTAKLADDEAKRLAQQWAPRAAMTHLLGKSIVAAGEPHASSGSWTFSFIDLDKPENGLQIVFRLKGTPVLRRVAARQLPHAQPLEIRAWGLDSDRAIVKAKQHFGSVSQRQMELTEADGRLVWSFDGKPLLEAMDGRPFQPLRRG